MAAVAIVLPARANDTYVTLSAGGLIPLKTSAIVMESEDLEVSTRQIVVKYTFRNTTAREIDALVAFPLPDVDSNDVMYRPFRAPTKDVINFVGFRVEMDGRQVQPKVEIRAIHDKRDVTALLRAAGLPLSLLDSRLERSIRALDPKVRARLEKEELLAASDAFDRFGKPTGFDYWPDLEDAGAILLEPALPRKQHRRSAPSVSPGRRWQFPYYGFRREGFDYQALLR